MVLEVPKTEKERNLNDLYMRWIRSNEVIPFSVLNRFKKDCEEIRKENKIYKNKI